MTEQERGEWGPCPHGLAPLAGPDRPCPQCEDEGYRAALAEDAVATATVTLTVTVPVLAGDRESARLVALRLAELAGYLGEDAEAEAEGAVVTVGRAVAR